MWCVTLIDLQIINYSCIPGINSTWSCIWSFLYFVEFSLLIFCWGFSHLYSLTDSFIIFYRAFVLFWYQHNGGRIRWFWEFIHPNLFISSSLSGLFALTVYSILLWFFVSVILFIVVFWFLFLFCLFVTSLFFMVSVGKDINFVYLFKKTALGFIDYFLLFFDFCLIYLFFISSLILIIFFLLLTLFFFL